MSNIIGAYQKPMRSFYPLTPLQESMFLESSGASKPWLYFEQIVCHLNDEVIDAEALTQAWQDAMIAYPSLRASVDIEGDDDPGQSVKPIEDLMMNLLDWSDAPATEIDARLAEYLRHDRMTELEVTRSPTFRLCFIRTGQRSAKLVWSFPHSLLDGRSMRDVLAMVFERYEALLSKTKPAPKIVTIERLFEEHCRALVQLDHRSGAAHFSEALSGWEGASGLVVEGAQSTRKQLFHHEMTSQEIATLEAVAAQAGVTFSTLVLAAWGVVTSRIAGRNDSVFGTTLSGRNLLPNAATAIGCFIVTIPLRMQVTPSSTFEQVLQKLRADQLAARPYEQTPMLDILEQTDVPGRVPLFDSVVMFDTGTINDHMRRRGKAWDNRFVELHEEGDVPLMLAAYKGETLRLTIEYDPSLVPQAPKIGTYLENFLRRLSTENSVLPLAQISMLSAPEAEHLNVLAGQSAPKLAQTTCLEMFQKCVEQTPDKLAVSQLGGKDQSFAEMDHASDQMAQVLLQNGVGPNDIIGLCLPRSAHFPIAAMAIWKAGAAFVPMDPSYPVETLQIIAEDTKARLVLIDNNTPQEALRGLKTQVLNIEGRSADQADLHSLPSVTPNDLAYVIFTSGSTGRPKGVMISHGALAAHNAAAHKVYDLTPQDRALQFASLSFDVALEEVFATLTAGATLVLRTEEMAQSMSEFLEQCVAQNLTVLNLPTGFWVALTDALEDLIEEFPPTVRMVIVGGERVPLTVLRRWRRQVPFVRWVNGYGPTEATITCTSHEVKEARVRSKSVPIGKPLAHANAWILAGDGSLAPYGTPGELWMSGPALAEGYIGRPDLTAERFVPAPFDPERRIYGTGDMVSWQDDVLIYHGRMDRQIKLRGFRIEPGQIEAVLESQPEVARAHVAVSSPKGSTPRLIGWVSLTDGQSDDLPRLTTKMAKNLPKHMRPTLVLVDTWPQTPGGKVDVAKLPALERSKPKVLAATADTPLTQEIATLFAAELGVENVAPDASFFDLGGNSLLMLRLLSKIERKVGTRLVPAALFADPTPMGVVNALNLDEVDPMMVIPIQPKGRQVPLYGVHVLGDNGSYYRPLAQELGLDQPLFGLTVGLLTKNTPRTVEGLAAFYVGQISRHQPDGPLSLIAVSAGSVVTMELAQQLIAAGRDVQAVILLDAEGPGGRPRVGTLSRLGVHAHQIRRKGWRHMKELLDHKREENALFVARRNLQKTNSADDGSAETVEAFMAANEIAIESYQMRPFSKRLTIIRAGDDQFDSAEGYRTGLGWSNVALAGFDLWDVPGDHLGILETPNVALLAQRVRGALRNAQAMPNEPRTTFPSKLAKKRA